MRMEVGIYGNYNKKTTVKFCLFACLFISANLG